MSLVAYLLAAIGLSWTVPAQRRWYAYVPFLIFGILSTWKGKKPTVTCENTKLSSVVSGLPISKRPYRPFVWLSSGIFMSMLSQYVLRGPRIKHEREVFSATDGGTLAIDWYPSKPVEDLASTKPIALILPGFGNNSTHSYVRRVSLALHNAGYDVAVTTFRGYGGLPLSSPLTHSTYDIADAEEFILRISKMRPNAPLLGVGFSLGANFLVKYVGQSGVNCKLAAAVSFGNPYDLMVQLLTSENRHVIMKRFYFLMESRAVSFLTRTVHRNRSVLASMPNVDFDRVIESRTLREFADRFGRQQGGFESVEAYYNAASCIHDLPGVRIPLICVSAQDDPVVVHSSIEKELREKVKANPNVALVETHKGGHLAWMEGFRGTSWMCDAAVQYGNAALAAAGHHPLHQ